MADTFKKRKLLFQDSRTGPQQLNIDFEYYRLFCEFTHVSGGIWDHAPQNNVFTFISEVLPLPRIPARANITCEPRAGGDQSEHEPGGTEEAVWSHRETVVHAAVQHLYSLLCHSRGLPYSAFR